MHRSLANDFALLFTDSKFDLAEHIDTVCLPQVVLIMTLMIVAIVMTLMEIILLALSQSGISITMDIIPVSYVTAWRTIPLLPMFCHWLGQRPVWGRGTISGGLIGHSSVESSSPLLLSQIYIGRWC